MSIISTQRRVESAPRTIGSEHGTPMPTLLFRATERQLVQQAAGPVLDGITTLDSPLPPDIADPERFAAAVTRHAIEALFGQRPVRQLQSWFTPALFSAFVRKAALISTSTRQSGYRRPARVCRIRCTFPRSRVVEAALVVHDGQRLRAVALRMEVRHDHWHVIALEIA